MSDSKSAREWTLAYSAGLFNHGRPEDILLEGDPPKLGPGEQVRVIEHSAYLREKQHATVLFKQNEELRKERDELHSKINNYVTYADNRLSDLTKERDRLRVALERIASRSEGDIVTATFDEPGAALIAREALK